LPNVQSSMSNGQAPKKRPETILTAQRLVCEYASAVLGVCMAYTRNLHDSEDMMQETFIKAIEKINTLRKPDRARSWLLQIARNTCIDHQRKPVRTRPLPNDLPDPPQQDHDNIERLYRAIARLSETYREPITLYYLKQHNCAAVAQALGLSEPAVRRRLVRARLQLHAILSEDNS
jgi:RNA polymerase sigma-70 factor (ECF subfamily)